VLHRPVIVALIVPCIGVGSLIGCSSHSGRAANSTPAAGAWRDTFSVSKSALSPTGSARYWVLQPGQTLVYKSDDGGTLIITTLDETKVVDGVAARVVMEREEKGGSPSEITRNYIAIDPATGDIYYLGEDSTTYKSGKPSGDGGSWLAGVNGARMGMLVPGAPKVGDRFYQEVSPKVAMDRAEIVGLDEKVKVPGGTFEHCLHVKETTPLDGDVTHKWYAPGVGLVKDDEFELASISGN
jgi:hypothetical protein